MEKLPAMQFYPGDWLRDNVSGCSLSAQGLWLRMMILAHDCDPYGVLEVGGVPMPDPVIAQRCGCGIEEYGRLLAELDSARVPSRTRSGAIFSRRMVRDAQKRHQLSQIRKKAGKNGGNPAFHKGKPNPYYQKGDKQKDNQEDNQKDKQKISPSSSVSSSASTKALTTTATTPPSAANVKTPDPPELQLSAEPEVPPPKAKPPPTVDGYVFKYLLMPVEVGGLGLSQVEAGKAGAMLKGRGGAWTPPKLAALTYSLSQSTRPSDVIAFARGCLNGKSPARVDFEIHENRAAEKLRMFEGLVRKQNANAGRDGDDHHPEPARADPAA